jgi:ribosomal protein S18 acetylase RimI-like enzyme
MRKLSFSIRPATIADYGQLSDLWEVEDARHRGALPHIFRRPDGTPRDRGAVASLIAGPDSAVLVADSGDEVIGAVTLLEKSASPAPIRLARKYVEIDSMVVSPSAQRQGIGRALMAAATEWARERGITNVELNVYEFNEAAAAFYRSTGFSTFIRRIGLW